MTLQSIVHMCLCCQVFTPDNMHTAFRYPEPDGHHQLRVSGYSVDKQTCWVRMKKEKDVDFSCPKTMFLISKPLLTSPYSLSSYTMMACQQNPRFNNIHSRRQIYLSKPLTLGSSTVSFLATATQNDSIAMHLQNRRGDHILTYIIGFWFARQANTVRRSVHIKGLTPQIEIDTPYFPYVVNRESNTTIVVLDHEFKIYVDNSELFTVKYLVRRPQIVRFRVVGTVTYRSIIIT